MAIFTGGLERSGKLRIKTVTAYLFVKCFVNITHTNYHQSEQKKALLCATYQHRTNNKTLQNQFSPRNRAMSLGQYLNR